MWHLPQVGDLLSFSPQEPQWHQRQAKGICHCPFHPLQRLNFWTLHPSGLQTSASPSEFQVSKDQNIGGRWGVQAERGLISLFCSGVAWASPSLFSSPCEEDPHLASFPRRGKVILHVPALEGPPSPAFVTMLLLVPGSAKVLGHPYQLDCNTGEWQIQRTPGVGMLPVEGEPFATICNLFSKVYFVTIYLSLKNGKLLPPKKKISKQMTGVIVSETMKDRENWGCLHWTAELSVGTSTGDIPVLQGREWEHLLILGRLLLTARWAVGLPQGLELHMAGRLGQRC